MKNHSNGTRRTIATIVGTRPEAIKLAPLIQQLGQSPYLKPLVISTSQHREMVRQIFSTFGISADVDLDVMRPRQTLWELTSLLALELGSLFEKTKIDAVVVQGDTTSAFVGGMCAFYHKIPVGHVEAGLRSHDRYSPFPEELNRQMLGRLSSWHFAPTAHSASLLTAENISRHDIFVCGNTVVDALHWMVGRAGSNGHPAAGLAPGLEKLVLVTCHRRENLGEPMRNVAEAVRRLSEAHAAVGFVVPMHPNPAVRDILVPVLGGRPNVTLCEPLDYDGFLSVLKSAHLVLSDSGGVQEEATALGKPVLVLRRETERPEGVEAGTLRLVGTDVEDIVTEASELLLNREAYQKMTTGSAVFGDGHASRRIVRILEEKLLGHGEPAGIPWSFAATNSARASMTSI